MWVKGKGERAVAEGILAPSTHPDLSPTPHSGVHARVCGWLAG